jgi:chromosome partitioning protein
MRENMAKTVALINMKGGVGKSTLTVNLAWQLTGIQGQDHNVLVVDLDPQFNASQYLLGAQGYQKKVLNPNTATIWNVFEQQTRTPGREAPKALAPADAIVTVRRWPTNRLDLLPSRLELAWSLKQPGQRKEELLAKFLAKVKDNYDLILIDCAPTESLLTDAAYLASDYALVPVKPEYLSTIGLPLLARSLEVFREHDTHRVEVLGIAFNHTTQYEPEEALSKREVRAAAAQFGWYIFSSEISYSRSYPKGAREGEPIFRTSHAQWKQRAKFTAFAQEFAKRMGL